MNEFILSFLRAPIKGYKTGTSAQNDQPFKK